MKIVIAGGSGQLGQVLCDYFSDHDVVILSRSGRCAKGRGVKWDSTGKTLDGWLLELEGADVLINMAGRIINCPSTDDNFKDIYWSRVDATLTLHRAVEQCRTPPKVWLNSSTATIYAHTVDGPANDEETGVIGGFERDAPLYWLYSVEVAKAWEAAFFSKATPNTRKVALRSSFVVETDLGGPFDTFYSGALLGMGGRMGSGKQWTSWIHEKDFCGIIRFLIERKDLEGVVNVCSPNPVTQEDFMATLRDKASIRYSLPMSAWMVRLATFMNRSDSEIPLKSRRVVPARLLKAGYEFVFPDWASAAEDSVKTWKAKGHAKSFLGNVMKLTGQILSRWCGNTGGSSSRLK